MTLLQSLTHRSFALLWSGQTISRLGDSLLRIALAWWVLEKTGSAVAMGTVLIFGSVPMLVFLLIGGVAVDRFPRARVMLASDLLRGILVTVITALAFNNLLELWHLYLGSAIFGTVDAFFQPAYTALVPEVTPREALPSANSLTTLSAELTGILGPAVGAAIVALGGTPIAFGLDALSFFISAVCLAPLFRLPAPQSARARAPGVLRDLREGFGAVARSPWLWVTITIAAFSNLTIAGPLIVSLPFLVKDNLHADVGVLGLVYSLSSLGAVLSAVWLGRMTRLRHRGLTVYIAWSLGGVMVAAIGLPLLAAVSSNVVLGIIAGAALSFGVVIGIVNLIWANTLQELVPRDLLGRVSSIDQLGSYGLIPVGHGVAGWMTDLLGAPLVFVVGGLATAGLGLVGLAIPAIRDLD